MVLDKYDQLLSFNVAIESELYSTFQVILRLILVVLYFLLYPILPKKKHLKMFVLFFLSINWVNFDYILFFTTTKYFLLFFYSLLKKEGRIKGEWSSKTGFSWCIWNSPSTAFVFVSLFVERI